jgi:3-deoxy-D-manno-octulosonic acid kinase
MNWTTNLHDPAMAGFLEGKAGDVRVLVKDGYEGWVKGALATDGAWVGVRSVAGGRVEHPLVALPDGEWAVVRRYRRGGMMRHVNRARYFLGHRAFEEVRATERARGAGVRVPEVLAAGEGRRRLGYEAWLATRWIEGAIGLDGWLASVSEAERLVVLRLAGEQIGMMHRGGVTHPDLNLRNLLVVAPEGGADPWVHLIDFDRARVSDDAAPVGSRRRNLERLGRSARKLGVALDPAAWRALREGYGEEWPLDPSFG